MISLVALVMRHFMTLGLIEHWKLQFLIPFPLLSTDRNQNSILNHPGSTPSAGDIWYCAHPIRQFEWPHLSALERQYNQRHPCCCYPLSHPTSFSRPHPIINPICWVKIQSAPNPQLPSQWVTKTTQHFICVYSCDRLKVPGHAHSNLFSIHCM